MNWAHEIGTVELLVGEEPEDSKRARDIQEKMLDLSLEPLVVIDAEYDSAIYGQSVLELAIVADDGVKCLVVEVDAESAELVLTAVEACKLTNASLVAVAMTDEGELVAGNFLPEQIPSPMFIVHLEVRASYED